VEAEFLPYLGAVGACQHFNYSNWRGADGVL